MPEIAAERLALFKRFLRALEDQEAVRRAREALKSIIVGQQIVLQPNLGRTHMTGRFALLGLGEQVLRVAGVGKSEQGLPMQETVVAGGDMVCS
jgi:hypothetical protein